MVLKKEDYKDLMKKIKARKGEEGEFIFPEDKEILIDIINKEKDNNEKEILTKIIELSEELVKQQ